jgi:hypothetical protein
LGDISKIAHLAKSAERLGNSPVSFNGGVLIAQCGGWACVAEAVHELTSRAAHDGRPGCARVAQVVESQLRAANGPGRPKPVLVEHVRAEDAAHLAGEHERGHLWPGEPVEVRLKDRDEVRGEMHRPHSCGGLWWADEDRPVGHVVHSPLDAHVSIPQVDVTAFQPKDLTPTQP